MNSKPLVSIITSSYNGEKYVHLAIESILNQTYKNIEYIFVDDGSTDKTKEIALSYEEKFIEQGMKFILISKTNNGAASGYNDAIKVLTGDLISAIDDDDFYFPQCIEKRVKFIVDNPSFGCVSSLGYEYLEGKLETHKNVIGDFKNRFEENQFENCLTGNVTYIPASYMLCASSFFKMYPEKEIFVAQTKGQNGQNWQMLLPVYAISKRGFIDEPLFGVQARINSQSRRKKTINENIERFKYHELVLVNTLMQIQNITGKSMKKYIDYTIYQFTANRMIGLANNSNDSTLFSKYLNILKESNLDKPEHWEMFKQCKLRDTNLTKLNNKQELFEEKLNTNILSKATFSLCNGCKACSNICPQNCITMDSEKKEHNSFWYPVIDKSKCIKCCACEKVCSVYNTPNPQNKVEGYVAYNKDTDVVLNSSSGGVFTAIANYIIDLEGVVFGVYLNEDLKVVHGYAETHKELEKFRTSKYVQSDTGISFKNVKKFLNENRVVLFTGTPCQIGGLKKYLGKDYDNLYCQDIICHGVPSPYIWEKYKEYQENLNNDKISKVNFRNKKDGWENSYISIEFENGKKVYQSKLEDLMFSAFVKNYSLRQSCYNCLYKTVSRVADITLADYWGMPNNLKEKMGYSKGYSLVLTHTKNGNKLFENVYNNLVYRKLSSNLLRDAIKHNSCAVISVEKPKNQERFINLVKENSLPVIVENYSYGLIK